VKKKNEKWIVYINFTNLNKACPEDRCPLPRIDQVVEAMAGHEPLASWTPIQAIIRSRYTYRMKTKWPLYHWSRNHCYKVMPFELKNAGVTFQRMINKVFKDLIRSTMEVYIDDILVKSV